MIAGARGVSCRRRWATIWWTPPACCMACEPSRHPPRWTSCAGSADRTLGLRAFAEQVVPGRSGSDCNCRGNGHQVGGTDSADAPGAGFCLGAVGPNTAVSYKPHLRSSSRAWQRSGRAGAGYRGRWVVVDLTCTRAARRTRGRGNRRWSRPNGWTSRPCAPACPPTR